MKSKILSRVLSVAAAAAMMATMATSAFAATDAKISTKLYIDDAAKSSYSATVGSPFNVVAKVFYGADDKSDSSDYTANWEVQLTGKAVVATSNAAEYGAAGVNQITETTTALTVATAAVDVVFDFADATPAVDSEAEVLASYNPAGLEAAEKYLAKAYVAKTDGKEYKFTPQKNLPEFEAADLVAYYTDGTDYYKVTYSDVALKIKVTGDNKGTSAVDSSYLTVSIKDGRFDAAGTSVTSSFGFASSVAGFEYDDGNVVSINLGADKTQLTYKVLRAIYEQEEPVTVYFDSEKFAFTIDGMNMDAISDSAANTLTNTMTFAASAAKLSRTVRTNIAEASKEYGADFSVSLASDPDDRDYHALDLSGIVMPDALDSMTITFDPDEVFGTSHGDLADFAADGELYMYLWDDGDFVLYQTLETAGRRDQEVTFEFTDGDQGTYIITTTKLEKGAASSSSSTPSSSSSTPASSSTAPSSDIPNTGDANVVAIAVMMAVIALGGAAVVAKKATK